MQVWCWSIKWSRSKANRTLKREHTGHSKHSLQKHKVWLHTWTSPDSQYWNQIGYILCSQRWRSSKESAKTRMGADYGLNHKLLIAKFRLKLKKEGKTTRLFMYNLNQIPYNYTVEGANRFKGLDLVQKVPEELWMEVHKISLEMVSKIVPKEMNTRRQNGGLTDSWEKKSSKRQRRKGKIYPSECRAPRIGRKAKKTFSSEQCKEIEENNRMGKN